METLADRMLLAAALLSGVAAVFNTNLPAAIVT